MAHAKALEPRLHSVPFSLGEAKSGVELTSSEHGEFHLVLFDFQSWEILRLIVEIIKLTGSGFTCADGYTLWYLY